MNSSAATIGPWEGELFRKILGSEWQKLHPDIRARFAGNPAPGKPLFYVGMGLGMRLPVRVKSGDLHFTSDSYFWEIFGARLPVPGVFTPGKTFLCHRNDNAVQFNIRIEIRYWLFGTTFREVHDDAQKIEMKVCRTNTLRVIRGRRKGTSIYPVVPAQAGIQFS